MPNTTKAITICLLLIVAASTAAHGQAKDDLLPIRKAAKPMVQQKRFEEAITTYINAGKAHDDRDVVDYCYEQAALVAMDHLQDTKRALTLADSVTNSERKASLRMTILASNKQYDQLLSQYTDANINDWPEEYRLQAFCARARAHLHKQNHDAAREDLQEASQSRGHLPLLTWSCYRLGQLYEEHDKDTAKALQAYERGVNATPANYAWRNRCFMRRAELLAQTTNPQAALKTFDEIDYDGLHNDYWRAAFYLCESDLHRQLDQFGQEVTLLTRILRLPEAADGQKRRAQERIDEITSDLGINE